MLHTPDTRTHLVPWNQAAAERGVIVARCGQQIRDTQIARLATPSCEDCRRLDAEDEAQLTALQTEVR